MGTFDQCGFIGMRYAWDGARCRHSNWDAIRIDVIGNISLYIHLY